MKNRYKLIGLLCFWAVFIQGQDWIFEYEIDRGTTVNNTKLNDLNLNTIHSIGLLISKGKKYKTQLLELDKNGKMVSLFDGKDCGVPVFYMTYGQDSVISITQNCNEKWNNTFDLFNKEGKKLFTKDLASKYSEFHIVDIKKDITFLKIDSKIEKKSFHFMKLSLNGDITEISYDFNDIKVPGLETNIMFSKAINHDEYLLITENYSSDESINYMQSFFLKNGKVQFLFNYIDKIHLLELVAQTDEGYLMIGEDIDGKDLVMVINNVGKEIRSFNPQIKFKGNGHNYYYKDDRLFSISNMIRGNIIYLFEYDINNGELLENSSISTDYSRVSNLQIGKLRDDFMIITGGCMKPSNSKKMNAFIMKLDLADSVEVRSFTREDVLILDSTIDTRDSHEVVNVKVYPNPAKFKVVFELTSDESLNVKYLKIFDMQGKMLISKEFLGNSIEADISMLAKGTYVYLIKLEGKSSSITGKVVVH